MNPRNFDMDVLRSMVAFADHGTLGLAAARVGRTQAALSLQMRKLEEQAGEPIFARTISSKESCSSGMRCVAGGSTASTSLTSTAPRRRRRQNRRTTSRSSEMLPGHE